MRKTTTTNDKTHSNSQGKDLPETVKSGDTEPAVKDLPPANPLGEPVKPAEAYSDGEGAEVNAGTNKPGETIVEHPLSPTDTNPNPHGTRSNLEITNTVVNPDTKVAERQPMEEGDVEVEGLLDEPVHLGDGRTLAKGDKTKVSKDLLKDDALKGKVKRV